MAEENGVDTASMPKTEAYTPIFDTGAHQRAVPAVVNQSQYRNSRLRADGGGDGGRHPESAIQTGDEPGEQPRPGG